MNYIDKPWKKFNYKFKNLSKAQEISNSMMNCEALRNTSTDFIHINEAILLLLAQNNIEWYGDWNEPELPESSRYLATYEMTPKERDADHRMSRAVSRFMYYIGLYKPTVDSYEDLCKYGDGCEFNDDEEIFNTMFDVGSFSTLEEYLSPQNQQSYNGWYAIHGSSINEDDSLWYFAEKQYFKKHGKCEDLERGDMPNLPYSFSKCIESGAEYLGNGSIEDQKYDLRRSGFTVDNIPQWYFERHVMTPEEEFEELSYKMYGGLREMFQDGYIGDGTYVSDLSEDAKVDIGLDEKDSERYYELKNMLGKE